MAKSAVFGDNSGDGSHGYGQTQTTLNGEMSAFDQLPPEVRKAVANGTRAWCATEILGYVRQGTPTAAIIEAVERQDKELAAQLTNV